MHRASLLWLAVMLCAAVAPRPAQGQEADTFSPVVSYQFLDSLASSDTPTTITSPIVSYQYFDWPGDENLTFQNSPNVSYYFDGAPEIIGQPLGLTARVGQTVTLAVGANGSPPLTFQWRLNGVNLPNTNGASIQIANAQQANSGSYSVVVQNGHGSVTSSEAVLLVYAAPPTPQPPPPQTALATEQLSPAQTAVPQSPTSQQLRVKAGATTVDPAKATVVLTHGWASDSDKWPAEMAAVLQAKYGSQFNIVAWDWRGNASTILSTAASRTVAEGTTLGQALMDSLGPSYNRPVHFMGHSLGTLVNCAAADYIHGHKRPRGDLRSSSEKYAATNTHMTLFDEAELVTAVRGVHLLGDVYLAAVSDRYAADGAEQLRNFWSKVIPNDWAWIDNYISEVGLPHMEAANVLLWRKHYVNFAIAPHGYAYEWYMDTVANPLSSDMGHRWSFERGTMLQAPVAPRYYLQNLDVNGSEMKVTPISLLTAQSLSWGRPIAYPTLKAAQGLNAAGKATLQALNFIGSGIVQVAGNVSATIGEALSSPGGTPVYLGTAGSTAAFFADTPAMNLNNLEANWGLNVSMQAGAPQPQQLKAPLRFEAMSEAQANESPNSVYTIIPVEVPADALGVSFEYQIAGGETDEFMTMGVGDESNFTMETKFVEDGAWNGTPVIDVSDYAGQETRLVFALSGASAPPTGVLSIRNIQFYIPPPPELTLELNGSDLSVLWPLWASGWTLEAATDLGPTSWQPETEPPEDADYFHTMTFDISTMPKGFFRLRK